MTAAENAAHFAALRDDMAAQAEAAYAAGRDPVWLISERDRYARLARAWSKES